MGVEQHTHLHGMTFAGEKAMEPFIKLPPPIDYESLNGKTLTIDVGTDYDTLKGVKTTVVIGTDDMGHSYVLVDKQELLHVHTK